MIPKAAKQSLFLLRVSLGWLFFYAGIIKVLNPEWTAAGFLANAQTFGSFYDWFASAQNIGWVNVVNEWGLVLIGAGLIFGTFTRLASYFGILLMVLYYLPGVSFPYVEHGFIVDDHIIFIFILSTLIYLQAGQYWGFDAALKKRFKLKSWWF